MGDVRKGFGFRIFRLAGADTDKEEWLQDYPGDFSVSHRTIHQSGWPMIALGSTSNVSASLEVDRGHHVGWIGGPSPYTIKEQRLDFMPLLPGFAINTIFYAAILGLLFFAPGPIRRFIRVKRHRCAACGYRIAQGVGPVCSECGHPLTKASS
jgi:hypothetical protein